MNKMTEIEYCPIKIKEDNFISNFSALEKILIPTIFLSAGVSQLVENPKYYLTALGIMGLSFLGSYASLTYKLFKN